MYANISIMKTHMHYIFMAQPNKISHVQIKEWTTVPPSLFRKAVKASKTSCRNNTD